jgi:hypothetical protein
VLVHPFQRVVVGAFGREEVDRLAEEDVAILSWVEMKLRRCRGPNAYLWSW